MFYRPDRVDPTLIHTSLPVQALTANDGWCDDINYPKQYNQHVTLPFAGSHEALWRDDHVYDLLLVVGYNDNPVQLGKGSAIFMHMARDGYQPTAGCIALTEDDLLKILPQLTSKSSVTIAANGSVTINT